MRNPAESGDDLWLLLREALGWQVGMPSGLTDEEEDLIDGALQVFTDWCDISSDVEDQGFPKACATPSAQ